jgi:hypothetical protein
MEVMPDLAGPLEVVVIDDGSNDGTEEVAWELVTSFPQFDFARNPFSAGLRRSLRTAYELTFGHHLLIHSGNSAIDVEALARRCGQQDVNGHWITDQTTSLGEQPSRTREQRWIRRVSAWRRAMRVGTDNTVSEAEIRLIRRSDLYQWLSESDISPRVQTPRSLSSKIYQRHSAHQKTAIAPKKSASARRSAHAGSDD